MTEDERRGLIRKLLTKQEKELALSAFGRDPHAYRWGNLVMESYDALWALRADDRIRSGSGQEGDAGAVSEPGAGAPVLGDTSPTEGTGSSHA